MMIAEHRLQMTQLLHNTNGMHQPKATWNSLRQLFLSSSIMSSHNHHFNYSASVMCYLGSSTPLFIIDHVLLKGGHKTLSVRNDLSAVYCVHKGDAAIWWVCTNVDWKEAKKTVFCLSWPWVKTQTLTGSPVQHINHWAMAPAELSNHNSYMHIAKRQSLQYCPCVHTARKC